jgi:DNA gyrase/topoisomerase IV subunit B
MADKLYNEQSIESLSPLSFTRLKPGVYAGDCTYSTQLLVEIVSNAVDEVRLGHGDKIEINIDEVNVIRVRDYGQGFIYSKNREDGKSILEAAFSVLNTSGKYREDGTYEGTSLGSFGIGSKITNFLSHWCNVYSYRNGQLECVKFVEGEFADRIVQKSNQPTGVCVEWLPSEEFFEHVEPDVGVLKKLFRVLVCLCPGLTIEFNNKGEKNVYHSDNGLNDLVDEATNGKEILKNRFTVNHEEGKNKIDFVLTYTSNYSLSIVPYVNAGLTEAGPHIVQIKTLLTREFNKFFREKGWLKDKDENLTGDDVQEGMYIVFNITAPNVGYDAQVKSRVTKLDMKPFTTILAEHLQFWLNANEKDVKQIADKALNARKAREAAKKARDSARNIKSKKESGLRAKASSGSKFIDCGNRSPKDRNLMIVEGVSAASAVVEARNPKTDAIYLLRGKISSPLKTDLNKLLASTEVADLTKQIGAGFGKDFDASKIQYDKIIIASDADSDGEHIELELMTLFFTYMRPLIETGHLYRAVTPLYIIRDNKKETYCWTEEEYQAIRKTIKGDVVRCKGLGELNSHDLKAVCFDNQRYKRITISDAEKAEQLLNVLMGGSADARKQYIYDNAERLGFNFD